MHSLVISMYLRYRSILFTIVQCCVVGAGKNWQTLLTEYAMSRRVNVKYCNAPTMLRYLVVSSEWSASPVVKDSFSNDDNGVATSLHFCIPTRCSKSAACFDYNKCNLPSDFVTSMPKKYRRSPRSWQTQLVDHQGASWYHHWKNLWL